MCPAYLALSSGWSYNVCCNWFKALGSYWKLRIRPNGGIPYMPGACLNIWRWMGKMSWLADSDATEHPCLIWDSSICGAYPYIYSFIPEIFNTYTAKPGCWNGWISDSYCSLKPLCSGMGEVVPARTSPTLLPPSPHTVLSLSCFKCRSASIVVTGTVRVNPPA